MEGESILQTMAEVSVALAGFTGVIAAFGQRRGQWTALDTLRFRIMLRTSLFALVFSILPIAVHHLGTAASATWAISSGLLASGFVIMPFLTTYQSWQLGVLKPRKNQIGLTVVSLCVVVVAVITLVLNALGIGFHRSFGAYFLGLCCVLLICALMFFRLLSFVGQQVAEE